MATKPMKRTGFNQGLFQESATAKQALGTLRITDDGRKFRYCKNGAGALLAGNCVAAAAIGATVMNEACASAHAVGDTLFTETITAGTAYAENYFRDGFLQINDATGEGHQYRIESSTAVGSAGTSITLTLKDPIRVALVASTSEFTIAHSPYNAVVTTTAEENLCVGVAPIGVTAAYYFWAQTGGPALAVVAGTPAVGTVLTLSGTAGALGAIATPLDVDVAYQVGIAWGTVGVGGESKPVMLTLD